MLLSSFFKQIYRALFSLCFFVTMLPLISYSCIKLVIIKIFYQMFFGRPFRILCGPDAFFQLHAKSYFTSHDCITSTLFIFMQKGSADIQKWRHFVNQKWFIESKREERASMFSKFQCRIETKFGFCIWENDPNFSVENHIRLWKDNYEDEETLMNICSRILHQSLSQDRSPWEIVLVKKKRNADEEAEKDDCYATVWKVHHSLCDGSLFGMILSSISDDKCQEWFRRK